MDDKGMNDGSFEKINATRLTLAKIAGFVYKKNLPSQNCLP